MRQSLIRQTLCGLALATLALFTPTRASAETTADQVRSFVAELISIGNAPLDQQPTRYREAIAGNLDAVLSLAASEQGASQWLYAFEVPAQSLSLLPLQFSPEIRTVISRSAEQLRTLSTEERVNLLKLIPDAEFIKATRNTNQLIAQLRLTDLPPIRSLIEKQSGDAAGETTARETAHNQKLQMVKGYLDYLPVSEKRILLSAYLRAPREASSEDKLNAVFQHVDPVLKKILQQMSFSLPDGPEKIALAKLLSKGIPFETDLAVKIIESDLGKSIAELFETFDLEPKAAGSIGQVYKARLKGSKKWVAVKVLRPDAEPRSELGIQVLLRATQNTPYASAVAQLRAALWQEFDFRNEAENMKLGFKLFPEPKDRLFASGMSDGFEATKNVLISDWIEGTGADSLKKTDPLATATSVFKIYRRWLIVAFTTGFFHTEPHLGNIKISDPDAHGQRSTVVLDWGSSDSLTLTQRRNLIRLMVSAKLARAEDLSAAVSELSNMTPEMRDRLIQGISQIKINPTDISRTMTQVLALGAELGMEFPPELIKFVRGWSIQEDQLLELSAAADKLDTLNPGKAYNAVAKKLVFKEIPPQLLSRAKQQDAVLEIGLFREILSQYAKTWMEHWKTRLGFKKCVESTLDAEIIP